MTRRGRRIRRTLFSLLALYVAGGIALYLLQDKLLFHPEPLAPDHRFRIRQPFREWNIERGGRNLNVLQFTTARPFRGIVLYFHGNMRNAERYAPVMPVFTDLGYEVWMPDYPGFGKSTGQRTEEAMYADAHYLYEQAVQHYGPENIVIYGRSIGTGVAAWLAARAPSRRLLLETPYYSIDALARSYFPFYPTLPGTRYAFPIYRYLKTVKAPVTLFHGTRDEVVPYRQARRLHRENPGTELITVPGGMHNNLFRYGQVTDHIRRLLGPEN
ncbi:MAG TPA: alpha/beta fold hydrolase [Chitinophagaceae bacterium]|nr:alpha/beta fold hydrolase [Chitinophagaceae bacterium]